MAIIDYGVIAKKNKEIVTKELFTKMENTLGFSIEKTNDGNIINGNYFIYLGDKEFYVGIYKTCIKVFSDNKCIGDIYGLYHEDYIRGTKYSHKEVINGVEFNIKRIDENNRFYGCFSYKGDFYEFIYGYGVDIDLDLWYDKNNKAMNKARRFYKNVKK